MTSPPTPTSPSPSSSSSSSETKDEALKVGQNVGRRSDGSSKTEDEQAPVKLTLCQLRQLKWMLKTSITKRHHCAKTTLIGMEAFVAEVEHVLARTVIHGENQSALIIGSCGTGKRSLVEQALYNLEQTPQDRAHFQTIYLSGSRMQNEVEAFREIVMQLCPNGSSIGTRVEQNFLYYSIFILFYS